MTTNRIQEHLPVTPHGSDPPPEPTEEPDDDDGDGACFCPSCFLFGVGLGLCFSAVLLLGVALGKWLY